MNDAMQAVDSASGAALPRDVAIRYMPIIRKIAYRMARRLPSHVTVDDLIGAGYLGLVDAFGKFDRARGDRFDAYAEYRIKGAILDELRSYDPLSRDLRVMANRIHEAVRTLSASLGRSPAESEIADRLGLPVDAFRAVLTKVSIGGSVSIDSTGAESGEDGGAIELGDTGAEPVDVRFIQAESKENLAAAIDQLPERLQSVLSLYYQEEKTLREIGAELGVTESRVCQLHGEAIKRLRALCATESVERSSHEGASLRSGQGRRAIRAA